MSFSWLFLLVFEVSNYFLCSQTFPGINCTILYDFWFIFQRVKHQFLHWRRFWSPIYTLFDDEFVLGELFVFPELFCRLEMTVGVEGAEELCPEPCFMWGFFTLCGKDIPDIVKLKSLSQSLLLLHKCLKSFYFN